MMKTGKRVKEVRTSKRSSAARRAAAAVLAFVMAVQAAGAVPGTGISWAAEAGQGPPAAIEGCSGADRGSCGGLASGTTCCGSADPDYPAVEAWFNGSNAALHEDSGYWLENSDFKKQVRGRCILENGRLFMLDDGGDGRWRIGEAVGEHSALEHDIYTVLKAFWKYASCHGGFVSVIGARGIDGDAVWVMLGEKDSLNVPGLCTFVFNAARTSGDAAGKVPAPSTARPDVIYEMGMNFRTDQLAELASRPDWRDAFLKGGRVLDQALADMQRDILTQLYGCDAGAQIYEFALEKYRGLYCKDPAGTFLKRLDLPGETRRIGNSTVLFNDDDTARTTLYITGK